jgi:hypothetical protein
VEADVRRLPGERGTRLRHEYRIDDLLGQLEVQVPGASRFRDSVLDLSSEIAEAKEGAGLASEVGSDVFCGWVDYRVDQQP